MKTSAILAIATLLAAAAGTDGTCLAGEKTGAGARSIISVLARSAVPTAELNRRVRLRRKRVVVRQRSGTRERRHWYVHHRGGLD